MSAVAGGSSPRTVVHLLRHGEVHNPTGVLYGRLPNFRLSDRGREQAELVAKALTGNDLVAVIASPLQRAQETAAPVAEAHGLEVGVDEGLIESINRFEGMPTSPGDGAFRNPRYWPWLRNPFRPSWGEPYQEIAQRMVAAVHRARRAGEGHEVLCVSHQLPIWTLRRYVVGQHLWHDPRNRQCGLASLTSLVFRGTALTEVRYTEPATAWADHASGTNPL
ncbi:histidine phosphatase family protein [Pseudonocardia humida]|uniref:Histidine phosphatase family protein n=1 Tax=Pseudonocardia humida TaxID=2800819 RepID=A0ABT1A183_9PSEU|nr:histidine phosphatase family protein [Pseudonocardia humida]MCO1656758.1 histidine phosphatase family protein [Pseudonocardia humida]